MCVDGGFILCVFCSISLRSSSNNIFQWSSIHTYIFFYANQIHYCLYFIMLIFKLAFFWYSRHTHSSIIVEHNHNKYTRPSDVRWITIEDLETERQYQFWVTAVTSAGEGMASIVITEKPSSRLSAKITSLSDLLFVPTKSNLNLQCSYVGEPIPKGTGAKIIFKKLLFPLH